MSYMIFHRVDDLHAWMLSWLTRRTKSRWIHPIDYLFAKCIGGNPLRMVCTKSFLVHLCFRRSYFNDFLRFIFVKRIDRLSLISCQRLLRRNHNRQTCSDNNFFFLLFLTRLLHLAALSNMQECSFYDVFLPSSSFK